MQAVNSSAVQGQKQGIGIKIKPLAASYASPKISRQVKMTDNRLINFSSHSPMNSNQRVFQIAKKNLNMTQNDTSGTAGNMDQPNPQYGSMQDAKNFQTNPGSPKKAWPNILKGGSLANRPISSNQGLKIRLKGGNKFVVGRSFDKASRPNTQGQRDNAGSASKEVGNIRTLP